MKEIKKYQKEIKKIIDLLDEAKSGKKNFTALVKMRELRKQLILGADKIPKETRDILTFQLEHLKEFFYLGREIMDISEYDGFCIEAEKFRKHLRKLKDEFLTYEEDEK